MSASTAPRRHPLDGPPVRVMLVDLTRAASEHFGVAELEIRSRRAWRGSSRRVTPSSIWR